MVPKPYLCALKRVGRHSDKASSWAPRYIPTTACMEQLVHVTTVGSSLTLISTSSIKSQRTTTELCSDAHYTYRTFVLCSPRAPTHIEQTQWPVLPPCAKSCRGLPSRQGRIALVKFHLPI